MATLKKFDRQKKLVTKINSNPFLTDEELSEIFNVSLPTIRLDRLELNIPEYRERIKDVAKTNLNQIKSILKNEIVGEIVSIERGKFGVSFLETKEDMVFEKTKVVRGHFIYSFAETLAISVIDAKAALVGVANIKYVKPVFAGAKLTAFAEIKRVKNKNFIVWVKIKENQEDVFRGKFILVSI